MNDQHDLFDRLKNEEDGAFEEVYNLAYKPVLSYVLNHGGDKENVKDIFQEGLIGLIKLLRKPDFKATANVTTLMFSICRNQWLKFIRPKGKIITVEKFPPGVEPVEVPDFGEAEQTHEETYQKVLEALEVLGENCKSIILMKHYQKLSRAEIAKRLSTTANYIGVRLHHCMNRLRDILPQ